MDSEKLKTQIGSNIAACRKQCGLTQAELAQKLNYSDKAVSKWERGESVPDVMTLAQLAEILGVTLNTLLGNTEQTPAPVEPANPRRRVNKQVIQMLVSILVWFVARFVYVVLSSMDIPKSWIGFVYALPANAITLLCLRSAWRMYSKNMLLISGIVWGVLISLYVSLLVFAGLNLWRLFLLGIAGQLAVILWVRLFRPAREEKNG